MWQIIIEAMLAFLERASSDEEGSLYLGREGDSFIVNIDGDVDLFQMAGAIKEAITKGIPSPEVAHAI